ncbi:hypothetical protein LDO32_08935 [Luteimonas sp. Y-2-2-4F]|nr:hypothetical protein [Luteimonas sp. Y-2-2-4F]MCD9031581.1 hypothetical protein [Luteimonas sp. Y-2-2-4F]MCD9031844.1 hypothetical protein [Luteimonas sp. Y-2-2-4F]
MRRAIVGALTAAALVLPLSVGTAAAQQVLTCTPEMEGRYIYKPVEGGWEIYLCADGVLHFYHYCPGPHRCTPP